ncbi:hypothetical protein ACQ1PL_09860, partial [Ornithobacterium rhinotracheale]
MKKIIYFLENRNIFNQRIIIARTLLAISALLLILFNGSYIVNSSLLNISSNYSPLFKNFSLFSLLEYRY